MKLMLLCLMFFIGLEAQSKYLVQKEEYQLKKGSVFNLRYQKSIYVLSYDIWSNEYRLVIKKKSRSFKNVDDVFIFFKKEKKFPYVYLSEIEKDDESDVFLVKFINDFFKSLIFRKINLNEIYK